MKKLIIFTILFTSFFLIRSNLYSENLNLIPKKKPSLSNEEQEQKITLNIIKPQKKPIIKKEADEPEEEIKTTKKVSKIDILVPKNKPKIVQKTTEIIATKSKYFSKKEFDLAKKAVDAFEKSNWTDALTFAKKTKNKEIINFVQWRHLLTTGNKASFYDYQQFIVNNSNYPRIGRINYLAEHKMSTKQISPKKIIQWFKKYPPLSGFGEMILGESFMETGLTDKGISLIKKGWITAK